MEVERGWVTLSGEVEHGFQKAAAEQDVRRVRGVLGLSNKIVVKPKVIVSQLSDDITHALHRSWFFDPQTIKVTAKDGRVRLSGEVKSEHERQVAAATAWRGHGVVDLENDLTVRPDMRPGSGRKVAPTAD